MTFTYDATDIATTTRDQVRFLIGDTDSTAPLLQDEEIAYAISVENNYIGAAARCCETIAMKFLTKADVRIGRGGTTLTYSTAAKQYTDKAKELRTRANALNVPWAGGTSIAEKESARADTDLVQPIFAKQAGDNPYVGRQELSPTDDGQSSA